MLVWAGKAAGWGFAGLEGVARAGSAEGAEPFGVGGHLTSFWVVQY